MSRVPNVVVVQQALANAWPQALTCAEVAEAAGLTLQQARRAMTALSTQQVVVPCNRPDVVMGWAWRVQR